MCWVSMLLHEHCQDVEEASKNKHLKHWLLCSTVFGAIWSIGATSDSDSRVKFDAFLRELIKGKVAEHPVPDVLGKLEVGFPDNGLVFDYFYVVNISFNLIDIRILAFLYHSTFFLSQLFFHLILTFEFILLLNN